MCTIIVTHDLNNMHSHIFFFIKYRMRNFTNRCSNIFFPHPTAVFFIFNFRNLKLLYFTVPTKLHVIL